MKIWAVALLFLLAAGLGFAQSEEEARLQAAINNERAAAGLPRLRWDSALASAAAAHTQLMVSQGELSHQYAGEPDLAARASSSGAHFRSIAENIALGPSPEAIARQWMHSAPHRANLLDPKMTSIGLALVRVRGSLYATADFSLAVESLSPQEIEQRVASLLSPYGVSVLKDHRDARQTCEIEKGSAGGSQPNLTMRWEGGDLSQLPPPLVEKLKTGRYHTAAVGSCTSLKPAQAFTSYRVAVLLYF